MNYRKIFIVGDLHGDFRNIARAISNEIITSDDLVIALGDVGVNFGSYGRRWDTLMYLHSLATNFLLVRGNHEQPPEECEDPNPTYLKTPTSLTKNEYREYDTGTVYLNNAAPNVYFAIDGATYIINGKSFLTIGGADSIDKEMRTPGQSWWPSENITRHSIDIAFKAKSPIMPTLRYDYILTHTCPKEFMPFKKTHELVNEKLLSSIHQNIPYDHWFCGHWHIQQEISTGFGRTLTFMDAAFNAADIGTITLYDLFEGDLRNL